MWIIVGTIESFHMQLLGHRHHWIGVEIFKDGQLVESWRDEGYLPNGETPTPTSRYPENPKYQNQWMRLK